MSNSVIELVASFEQLSRNDQAVAMKELWRHFRAFDESPSLDDEELALIADDVFQMYDQEEQRNGST